MQANILHARQFVIAVVLGVIAALLPVGVDAAHADTPNITGIVVNESNVHLANVAVAVLNGGSTVTSTTTDDSGAFGVTVPDGVYDLQFTPPQGSGLAVYTATGHDTSNTAPLTVVLHPIIVIHVSGVVRDVQGNVYPSTSVSFRPGSGPTSYVTADASGVYGIDLLSGPYNVTANVNKAVVLRSTLGPSSTPR